MKTPNGSVNVTFPTYDCGKYDSFNYVVYEEVFVKMKKDDGSYELKLIGEHKDLSDRNQTVRHSNAPKTGDNTPIAILLGLLALAAAGIGVVIWRKKKL